MNQEIKHYHLNGRTLKFEPVFFKGTIEELIKDTESTGAKFNGVTKWFSNYSTLPVPDHKLRVFASPRGWFKLIPDSLFPKPLPKAKVLDFRSNVDQALYLVRTMLNSGEGTGSIDTGDLLADLDTVRMLLEGGTNARSN